jgi:leucine dehydrogenase
MYDKHRSRRVNDVTAAATSPEELTVHAGRRSGLPIVIAVDSTRLGPALGGCRIRSYPSLDSGRQDALRLASAMTFTAAPAGPPHGGGKTVVVLPDGAAQIGPLRRRDLLLDGAEAAEARARVVSIAATLRPLLADAARHDTTPHDIATDRARERLRRAPSVSADAS